MPEVLALSDLGFWFKESEIRDLCYPVRSRHFEAGDLENIIEKAIKHDFGICLLKKKIWSLRCWRWVRCKVTRSWGTAWSENRRHGPQNHGPDKETEDIHSPTNQWPSPIASSPLLSPPLVGDGDQHLENPIPLCHRLPRRRLSLSRPRHLAARYHLTVGFMSPNCSTSQNTVASLPSRLVPRSAG